MWKFSLWTTTKKGLFYIRCTRRQTLLHQVHQKTTVAIQMPSSCRWIYSPGTRPGCFELMKLTNACVHFQIQTLDLVPDIVLFEFLGCPLLSSHSVVMTGTKRSCVAPRCTWHLDLQCLQLVTLRSKGYPLITPILTVSNSKERNKMHFWGRQMQH